MFALGVVAYELLTYRKPFRGEHLSTVLYKILNETPEPADTVAPDVPAALAGVVSRAMEKDIALRYPSMEVLRLDLQVLHRQLVGSSARLTTVPRLTQAPRQTTTEVDPDATIATPSKGMLQADHITPPSGALARVPAPADPTPTSASLRREAGLELVNFRGPGQDTTRAEARPTGGGQAKSFGAGVAVAVVAAAAIAGAWFFLRSKPLPPLPKPEAKVTSVPTAPLVFPQPVVGHEPGTAKVEPAAPQEKPTAIVAEKKPEPPKTVRRFKIQFSSIPAATLYVDGRKVGFSIPAKVVELAEGSHAVRLEGSGLPTLEKELKVGPASEPRFAYRFPVGYLVIKAPDWVGASVLIDSKFKGILSGEMRVSLSSGDHRVTLSREGVDPVTANVAVPEGGDKQVWTPHAPVVRPGASS